MSDDGEVEELPDLAGLRPVLSLAELRANSGQPAAAIAGRPRCSPQEALRQGWGYDTFRPLQGEAVAAVMAGRDALVVLPTGGGKSLCYQIPPACGAGLALVVSPLIALMDDQVAGAREAGLDAAALHSNLPAEERRALHARLEQLDLLYVSPERLLVGDLLPRLAPHLTLIAVDEAHCVSHWGHDFRPEYRQLAGAFALAPKAVRMALTATATPQVQQDIAAQLGLRDPLRLIGHPDRPNLIYRALPRQDAVGQILELVRRHQGAGGIVYALTRKEVERLANALRDQGVDAAAYHAGLDAATRARVQADFVGERLAVVVATIAFGMGIDRSDVRFVVHAAAPKSIEHYQQESGRAGRDGLVADCVLLHSPADFATHRRLAELDGPLPPERLQALQRQLRQIGAFCVAPLCRHRLLAEHFGQPWPPPGTALAGDGCGACDVCLGETRELPAEEALLTAQKILSAAWRLEGRFGSGQVMDVLLGRDTDKIRRAGHDQLSVYGMLKDAGDKPLRAWFDQLVVQGLLELREDGFFTFCTISEAGRALCRGQGTVRLGMQVTAPKRRRRKGGKDAPASAAGAVGNADDTLFQRLRALRKRLAQKRGVPPYVVFHDTVLRQLAQLRPQSLEALRLVKGIGERKVERYGAALLEEIGGA
jgi:ATP-dependent DNA helicase RecQ